MSYPAKLLLSPNLCEALFLILALLSTKEISEKMDKGERIIGDYMSSLMWLFFQTTETNRMRIYHAGKNCRELVTYLVNQYGDKYKDLVEEVRSEPHITFKLSDQNGTSTAYVWPSDTEE